MFGWVAKQHHTRQRLLLDFLWKVESAGPTVLLLCLLRLFTWGNKSKTGNKQASLIIQKPEVWGILSIKSDRTVCKVAF